MFIIDDRYKNYGLEYTMSYTLTQYQTTPGISRDYVSTFELGSFSANRSYRINMLVSGKVRHASRQKTRQIR